MVDFFSYNQYVSGGGQMEFEQPAQAWSFCACATCFENQALMDTIRCYYDDIDGSKEFDDEQYLICPPRVLGYFTVKKTWSQLLAEDIRYIEKNIGDAFKKLILDDQRKTLIESLASKHGEDSEDGEGSASQAEDIIEGKGKGVVILLHGQ